MKHWHVPGVSVAVINGGVIECTREYGEAELGGRRVNTETIFQTGSLGKMLTAATVLTLVDRGMLDLDKNVNEYLSSWHLAETDKNTNSPVTLEKILNHSAGLTVHGFPGYEPGDTLPTLLQMLNGEAPCNSGPVTVYCVPGTEWRYSGGGYLVAQQVVEDVTGQTFSDVVRDLVTGPLGMERTYYRSELGKNLMQNASSAHQSDGSIISGRYRAMPEYGAGAGLWSTPSDLAKLGLSISRAWLGGKDEPITTGTARDMLTQRLGSYGLGTFVSNDGKEFMFFHGGDNTGFHAFLVIFPELGCGAAVMTNGDGGIQLYMEIRHAIADTYEWPDFRPIYASEVRVDPALIDSLAGTYEINGIGKIPLMIIDSNLHMPDIFGGGNPIKLYPVDSRTFVDIAYGLVFVFEQNESNGARKAKVNINGVRVNAVKVD
jgi:CubicO group peptidase (beta-lactamase class C family)